MYRAGSLSGPARLLGGHKKGKAPSVTSVTADRLDSTFVLNPHLNVIHCSDDEILIKHGSRSLFSETIVDDRRTKLLGRVLSNMRTPATLRGLFDAGVLDEHTLPAANELVEYLEAKGVLVDPEAELIGLYLDGILGRGSAVSAELSRYTVGLVGAGPLGGRIASDILALRPGGMTVADSRCIDNPEAARMYLTAASAAVERGDRLETALVTGLKSSGRADGIPLRGRGSLDGEALDAVFEEADFVVAAWESYAPTLFHSLNEAAIRHSVPWLLTYCDGSEAIVGPLYVPSETACYYEFETQVEASTAFREDYLLYKEHLADAGIDGTYFVLPPYLQIASGFATLSASQFLARGQAMTVGRSIRIDFERLSVDYQDVLKLPRCPACGSERAPYRQLFL